MIDELKEENNNLKFTLNNIGAYLFTKDIKGCYTYANQKVCELFKLPLEEIIGQGDTSFFDLEKSNDLRKNDLLVFQEAKTVESEELNVSTETGEHRYYQTVKKPLLSATGDVIGLFGVSIDITEQKNKQLHLIASHKALLQLTREGYSDTQVAFEQITKSAARTLGIKCITIWLFNTDNSVVSCRIHYFRGKFLNLEKILQLKDYPQYLSALNESGFISADNAQDHPFTEEFNQQFLKPLGISSMLNAPIHIHGKVIGIVCYAHLGEQKKWSLEEQTFARSIADICAQVLLDEQKKQSEELLVVSERQLKSVIEGAQLGYWDWNYQTGAHAVNKRWLFMLGLSREDIKGHVSDWDNLIHPDDRQSVIDIIEAHIQSGGNYVAEFRMRHKKGHWVWIQGSGAVVEYDEQSDKPLRLCGTHEDISKRKNIDLELERLVVERTKELEIARNVAERANNAKSEFLSSMSHELRTPMNAVLGFSQLLATDTETPLTKEQQESVGLIINGGEHLLSLINDVLDLAKIESGHNAIKIEAIQIKELIQTVCHTVLPQAEQNSITIINNTAEEMACVLADLRKLKQVLLNLASNAIKYNSKNGSVTFAAKTVDGKKMRMQVSDTGKGVAEELFSGLFEPFNRLDKANSNIQGTGIGLTICKQLVELMDGEIGVFKNPEKGLTFWVEFKLAEK